MFESCKNVAMGTATLTKSVMPWTCFACVALTYTEPTFSSSSSAKSKSTWLHPKKLKFEAKKKKAFCCTNNDKQPYKYWTENICKFLYIFRLTCVLAWCPLSMWTNLSKHNGRDYGVNGCTELIYNRFMVYLNQKAGLCRGKSGLFQADRWTSKRNS